MIRLVASDLDGTLLAPDGTIAPDTVAALAAAHGAGIRIVVATGRPIRWLDCLDPIRDLQPFVLASNGGVHFDLQRDQTLSERTFDAATVADLTGRIRAALPDSVFGLERGDLFGTEPDSPDELVDAPDVLVAPVAELTEHVRPVVKLIVYSRSHDSGALASAIATVAGPLASVTHSFTHDEFGMAELSVPGVTKGSALADLCASLRIDARDVAAFGDMPNDVEMLTWAGHGFVTANGHPELLRRFQVVESCADGGVGRRVRALLG